MNRAIKEVGTSLINSKVNPFDLKVALFHSTPVLFRKRRNNWEYDRSAPKRSSRKPYHYSRRYKKLDAKEELLRNVGAFAESLFQNGQFGDDDDYDYEPSSSRGGSSWFKRDSKSHNGWKSKAGGRRSFEFCDVDDFDVETIFRSSFGGGSRFFYWSFIDEEQPRRSSSWGHQQNYRTSWNKRHHNEDEYDDSSEDSDSADQDLTSERLALGLSSSGPLNLEDVKNAYRACAMKWHPDRHAGSSKAVAEEKFKTCSAAYQSLCDKMALN